MLFCCILLQHSARPATLVFNSTTTQIHSDPSDSGRTDLKPGISATGDSRKRDFGKRDLARDSQKERLCQRNLSPTIQLHQPQQTKTDNGQLVVRFDATGSRDPDGTIIGYRWQFGDGTRGNGIHPSHIYVRSGNYTATLTVTDDCQLSSQQRLAISILEPIQELVDARSDLYGVEY